MSTLSCIRFLLLTLFLFQILSCTKEGAVGPQGFDGLSGTKILSGTTTPTLEIGVNGDYYLQTNNGFFYGPKSESGWGVPLNLVGTPGTPGKDGANGTNGSNGTNGTNGSNGTNGATIISGTAAPSTAQGVNGDFYFNKSTGDFYGPKTAAGWGAATNLKGINGTNGSNGTNGTNGTNGIDGAPGSQILSGTALPTLVLGRIGDFYFQTTTSDFYGPRSATSWGNPVNLRGATGTSGTNGTNGTNGSNGVDGAPGSKILSGTAVPPNGQGAVGDYYINISNGDMYGPKSTSGWGAVAINLRGPSGVTPVYYSGWYAGGTSLTFNLTALALTADVFNKGQVLVYEKYNNHGTDEIRQLNGEIYTGGTNAQVFYNFRIELITIRAIYGASLNDKFYRYIIIPGNTAAPTPILTFNKIPSIDYNKIKIMYNISD